MPGSILRQGRWTIRQSYGMSERKEPPGIGLKPDGRALEVDVGKRSVVTPMQSITSRSSHTRTSSGPHPVTRPFRTGMREVACVFKHSMVI